MPTPMRLFADIASRHGVDPSDDAAVDDFFARVAPTLPKEQQALLFSELLEGDAPPVATEPPAPVEGLPLPPWLQEVLSKSAQSSEVPAKTLVELYQENLAQTLRLAQRERELRLLK